MADSVHSHNLDLQGMLRMATSECLNMGVVLNYMNAKEELIQREEEGRVQQGEVWQECDRRELRMNLTIRLNQFELDMKEVNTYVYGNVFLAR